MMTMSVSVDLEGLRAKIAQATTQGRLRTAKAITFAAEDAQKEVVAKMQQVFFQPTRFTLNSIFKTAATPEKLYSLVGIKDAAFKGVAPVIWLAPQVYGGGREHKRFEQSLQSAGVLPHGWYAMPAGGIRRNRAFNINTGQLQKVLSGVRAQRDVLQNTTARSKLRGTDVGKYFAIRSQDKHLKPGIYLRTGANTVKPIFIFTPRAPHYNVRLPFYDIVLRVINERFAPTFERLAA